MLSFVFFVVGAVVASFAGVITVRLFTGQSILSGRSRCDVCGKVLTPFALVPIVSYIVGAGRARCCGARLSPSAPLSELLLGTLYLFAFMRVGLTAPLFFILLALALLLILVFYDFAHQILPSEILALFVLSSAAAGYLSVPLSAYITSLVVALALASFLALIHLVSGGRAMGLADAPLVFGLALLTGDMALSGFFYSFWIGACIGIILLVRRPPGSRMGVEVPFAPFLAAGFLLAYFTQWNLIPLLISLPTR